MAHTYTPGLTVTARTVVSKTRVLPLPGTVLVSAGDAVTSATVVARAELPGRVHVVNLVNQLGILPEDLPDYMVKRVGDRIQRGDVLAETKAFITWFKTQVRAPITGTVETISTATGQVILREPPRPVELFAYLDGTVAEVLPGQGARVETTCAFIQGIFGIGGTPMARRTFELLRKLDGRKASISGATQIRAGVIRPEIIVPLAPGEQIPGIETGQRGEVRGGVKVGDPVRVIRAPFFGRIGHVVGLPSDLQMIPTESRVRVMEVQFTDGSRAVIPRANVEVIEGIICK